MLASLVRTDGNIWGVIWWKMVHERASQKGLRKFWHAIKYFDSEGEIKWIFLLRAAHHQLNEIIFELFRDWKVIAYSSFEFD